MMKYEIVAFYKQEIEEIRECAENIGRLSFPTRRSSDLMDGGIDVKKYPVAENCFQPAWERIVFFVC